MGYVLLALWVVAWFVPQRKVAYAQDTRLPLGKLLHYALMIVFGFILWMLWTIARHS